MPIKNEFGTGVVNSSLEMAIDACILHAKAGDAIILSPACASWDMFDNYKHRAKVFVDYINAQIN